MTPLAARAALDTYFLEARCRLLDLAAALDRVDRGADRAELVADPRLEKIRQAIAILSGSAANRAEQIQMLFSLDYDPAWKRPTPKE